MTRDEFIRRLIVNSMCDDFENFDQVIWREVAEVAAKCGLTVERSEIVRNLRDMVGAGLVKVYDLSVAAEDPFATELEGMPSIEKPQQHFRIYFYPTKKGMDWHQSDSKWWPFD